MDPLDPQIWLIIVALGHTGPGVLLATNWADDTAKMIGGWMLLTSITLVYACLLYTSPSPRDRQKSRMPSSA